MVEQESRANIWRFRGLITGQQAEAAFRELRERGRVERWGHAARIHLEGEHDELIVVLSGRVMVGRELRLGRGDAFAPFSGESQEVIPEARAHQETTIVVMERDELRDIVEPILRERAVVSGSIFNRQELRVPLAPLLRSSASTRLGQVILEIVERYGEHQTENLRRAPALSTAQLASLAGLERERTRRALTLLERAGLIARSRGALTVRDLEGLRHYVLG
ncbi:Crp/Fnr family transcriptional regulator [Lujinxingia litoralis]|uniref:Crp/Fnr family transcriptional regulator n=1 Tax=Lujinxingia litoralis TaxID=2211119 RepID=UPI001314EFA6|nr:helix-turn-helix domain-containing protein [Lujinxingia litoralis]